ncbi:MAG: Zn-dependent alcohol dehydrogenase [Segetibacter sp.]|nr:Zn-dependent alcohol dehydrogenase [Segetibacter sp.]
MKANVLTGINQPFIWQEVTTPQPLKGEVLIKIQAAALNHRDLWIQKGQYAGLRFPIIVGSDGSGIVTQVGEGVDETWIGKEVIINPGMNWGDEPAFQSRSFKVLGLPDDGTFAEYVKVPVENVDIKPSFLSWDEAAAIPLAGLTGYRALFTKGGCKAGSTVLISGVGGGVALITMQMALAAGAEVYVTSGDDSKIERSKELGAKEGVNYKINGWHKLLQSAVDGFDVIIDSAAGESAKNFIELARPGGRIVFYGGTQGPITTLNPQKLFWKQLSLLGSTIGTNEEFKAMLSLFETHTIHPVVDAVFKMEEAEQAVRKMEKGEQFGKILLRP